MGLGKSPILSLVQNLVTSPHCYRKGGIWCLKVMISVLIFLVININIVKCSLRI